MEEILAEAAEELEVPKSLEHLQETQQIVGFPEMEVTEEDATSINFALEQ